MEEKKKKPYQKPMVRQIEMEKVIGIGACKTAEPTGGANAGGSCDGLIGSPPTTACSDVGS